MLFSIYGSECFLRINREEAIFGRAKIVQLAARDSLNTLVEMAWVVGSNLNRVPGLKTVARQRANLAIRMVFQVSVVFDARK